MKRRLRERVNTQRSSFMHSGFDFFSSFSLSLSLSLSLSDLSNKTVNLTLGSRHLCLLASLFSCLSLILDHPLFVYLPLFAEPIASHPIVYRQLELEPRDDASRADANTPIYIDAEEHRGSAIKKKYPSPYSDIVIRSLLQ